MGKVVVANDKAAGAELTAPEVTLSSPVPFSPTYRFPGLPFGVLVVPAAVKLPPPSIVIVPDDPKPTWPVRTVGAAVPLMSTEPVLPVAINTSVVGVQADVSLGNTSPVTVIAA